MGGLFGGGKAPQAQKQQPAGALNVQTSIYGSAYPLVYGKNRVPVNLIHYVNFKSIAHTTKQKTGGKGGGKAQSQTTYTYQVAMAASVGVGGSGTGVGTVWKNKEKHTLASLGLTFFTGAAGQTPWSYLTGSFPAQAVPYANMSYIAAPAFQLGDSPSLPNLNIEFKGLCQYSPGSNEDALMSDIIVDYLTDARHGAGFGGYLADMDTGSASFRKYCLARGIFVSPIENNQRNAGAALKEWAEISNAAMVWRNGKLHFIPYGDVAITGNGATYTPDLTPLYDLTEKDFLFERNQPPVKHSTKNPSQQYNHVRVEYNNRANDYNPSIAEVKDAADIDDNGLRTKPVRKCTAITNAALARDVAQLEMQRDLFVVNSYSFRLGVRHSLLEPMDYVTITEPGLGLDRQLVRIIECTEQDDSLDVTVEEVLVGVASAPLYNTVGPQGYNQDFNASPGNTQDPLIMNAPGLLTATGYEMWINACGVNFDLWGGCQVWISDDNAEYRYVGAIMGPARYGALAANFPAGSANYDTTSVARVQLYSGQLLGGTQEDCDDWRTLLYIGGEWVSYRDAVLVSGTTFDLDTFRRAGYGSIRAAHTTGQAVAMIDEATFRLPYDQGNVGKQVYFKFPAFNVFGGGAQDLAACVAYPHTIGASEITAPMEWVDVDGIYAQFTGGGNRLPNTDFMTDLTGWFTEDGGALMNVTRNMHGTGFRPPNVNVMAIQLTSGPADGKWAGSKTTNAIGVIGNKRYITSAYFGAHRCNAGIQIDWFTKTGTYISTDGDEGPVAAPGNPTGFEGYTRRFVLAQAPATAASATIRIFARHNADVSAADAYLWIAQPMFEEATLNQTQPSPYSSGMADVYNKAAAAIAAAAAAQDTADGVIDTYYSPTAPVGAKLGDFWYDQSNGNRVNRWNGSSWVVVQDTAIATAISNAAGAQATADGKVKTFYAASTSAPSPSGVGDLWYQTDLGLLMRWNGSSWVKISDNSSNTSSEYLINGSWDAGNDGWTYDSGYYTETGGIAGGRRLTKFGGGSAGRALNDKAFACAKGECFSVSALLINGGFVGDMKLGFVFYDAAGNVVDIVENTITGTTSTWTRKKTVVVSQNASVAYARAAFFVYSHTSGFVYVDDMRVTKLASDASDNIIGIGKNLLPNSDFGGLTGTPYPWKIGSGAPGAMSLGYKKIGVDGGASWTLSGERGVISCSNGYAGNAASYWDIYCEPTISVEANQRYEFSVYYANHRCNIYVFIQWFDASGNHAGYSGSFVQLGPDFGGGAALTGYGRTAQFGVAPSNATSARMFIRRFQHASGEANSYAWFTQPYFGKATANQNTFTDWSPGSAIFADQLGNGDNFGVLSVTDLYTDNRLGLRVSNSGQRLGSQRNTVRAQTSSYGSVRTTTALTATSAGAVSVNAHTVRYGSFSVSYNAVSNAITGLTVGSTYVIYCYDGDYSGGTKTYYAGTNPDAIMQLGDDVIVIGQITIPSSGSGSGGGGGGGTNPGDWCVDAESFLPDGTLAGEIAVGRYLPCYNNRPEDPNIVHLRVQANRQGESECLRMSTVSGATVVASVTTPMTLRNGACVLLPEMLHREALVYRYDGTFTWEEVVALEPVGVRRVAKISVSDQCYFAGESKEAFIATHNIQQIKP